jgi:hypothetical protein
MNGEWLVQSLSVHGVSGFEATGLIIVVAGEAASALIGNWVNVAAALRCFLKLRRVDGILCQWDMIGAGKWSEQYGFWGKKETRVDSVDFPRAAYLLPSK